MTFCLRPSPARSIAPARNRAAPLLLGCVLMAAPSHARALPLATLASAQPEVAVRSGDPAVPTSDGKAVSFRLPDAAKWSRRFPVVVAGEGGGPACAVPTDPRRRGRRRYLSVEWLRDCLTDGLEGVETAGPPASTLSIRRSDLTRFYGNIERVNTTFFQNGYVNSGVVLDPADDISVITLVDGQLAGSAGKSCAFDRPVDQEKTGKGKAGSGRRLDRRTYRYVHRRLMAGCDSRRPFNVYLLERDFRRLADDNEPWIDNVNMRLNPRAVRGQAELVPFDPQDPASGGSSLLPTDGPVAADRLRPPPFVVLKPRLETEMGLANDRSPSIGSLRSFAGLSLRGPAGFLLSAETGVTEGAVDGAASLLAALGPRLSLRLTGDFNQAEVVDPVLRPLDIRSHGWGMEASILHGAIRCPLTPLFGVLSQGSARYAVARRGLESCRLAARFIGDVSKGWASARDLTFGLTLSHRSSQSFLLGEPFSFAPGSVDGRSHVTALRATADWLQRGRIGEDGERGWTLGARLGLSIGIDGSETDIAGLAAPSPHFILVSGQIGYSRQLNDPGLVLSGRLSGQWANGLLYTSDRMPVGGVNSVRGYPQATLLVDRGLAGSIELSRSFNSSGIRGASVGKAFDPMSFRISVFADGAIASNLNPATRRRDTLASVGLGLAWTPSSAVTASVEYGLRLGRDLAGPGPALVNEGLHVGLSVRPLLF